MVHFGDSFGIGFAVVMSSVTGLNITQMLRVKEGSEQAPMALFCFEFKDQVLFIVKLSKSTT
jgi:hypothetical protein